MERTQVITELISFNRIIVRCWCLAPEHTCPKEYPVLSSKLASSETNHTPTFRPYAGHKLHEFGKIHQRCVPGGVDEHDWSPLLLFVLFSISYVLNLQRRVSHQQPVMVCLGPYPSVISKGAQNIGSYKWHKLSSLLLSAEWCSFSRGLFFFHSALFVLPSARESRGTRGSGCIMSVGIGEKQERTTVFAI